MKKQKIINTTFLILLILGCLLIFFFSSQNGEESTKTSSGVVKFILSIFIPSFSTLVEEEQVLLIREYSHLIRKLAHFSEFMYLGFTAFSYLSTKEKKIQILKRGLIAFIFGVIYAISDEVHQIFTSSRGPSARDVLIDSSGVFTGVLVAFLIFYLIERKHK